jgi:hypothetical protein
MRKRRTPAPTGGVEQVPCPLLTHAVVGRVVLTELARVQGLREVSELVDHGLRFGPRHERAQPFCVEDVAHYCFGAEVVELAEVVLRPGYRGHLVTRLDQSWHQSSADGAGCTCHKDSHNCSPPFVVPSPVPRIRALCIQHISFLLRKTSESSTL